MIRALGVAVFMAVPAAAWADGSALSLRAGTDLLDLPITEIAKADVRLLHGFGDVTVTLAQVGAAALAEFTAKHVGEDLSVSSCGKELARPRLVEAISGGSLIIAEMEQDAARQLVAVLTGQAGCGAG